MARSSGKTPVLSDAFGDYRRAKRVWQVLARRQQENPGRTSFPLDPALLHELGFTRDDLHGNIRDLQRVLTRLQEFTWHWDRDGPLSSRPGEPGPIAYIIDGTLTLGPQFSEARAVFMAYSGPPGREFARGSPANA